MDQTTCSRVNLLDDGVMQDLLLVKPMSSVLDREDNDNTAANNPNDQEFIDNIISTGSM